MQKIKYIICLLISLTGISFMLAKTAVASTAAVLQIQSLPGFINYTDFKLSCTTDGTSTANFYVSKDNVTFNLFNTVNLSTNPCQTNVNGTQFGSEGTFYFKVTVDSLTSTTSTTLDTTAPSAPSNFGKVRSNGNTTYTISWKNPLDTDFVKVYVYRSTTAGFNADNSNKVAEIGGNPGDTQSWTDSGLDANKEYYYYARAIDHANNASGLVGDSSTTTVVTTPTPGTGGAVTVLPKEQGTGSVLGSESTPSPEATVTPQGGVVGSINQFAAQTPEPFRWILTHKKISLGILIIFGLIAYNFLRSDKRK